ncbi:MAG: hypothetical protein J6A07_05475 [Firmicutes bacterium]|nr:hypothetical protein [Bacillota bacterium]
MKRKIKLACLAAITAVSMLFGGVYVTAENDAEKDIYSDEAVAKRESLYTLTVDDTHLVTRSAGPFDDEEDKYKTGRLKWIIKVNDDIVETRCADDEMSYRPEDYGEGIYQVWLTAWTDGDYRRISNVAEWSVDGDIIAGGYVLSVDESGLVTRSFGMYDENSLTWVVSVNGTTDLKRNAEDEMSYRPGGYGSGTYRVWLEAFVNGDYRIVSNIVTWDEPMAGENSSVQSSTEVIKKKTDMKSIVKHLDIGGAGVEYKHGFVIDPNGDGEYNGCIMFAGRNSSGEEVQHIFDNDDHQISFSTSDITEHNVLYVWCDKVTGRDYIVCVQKDVNGSFTGTDCCTGTEVFTKNGSDVTVFGQKADLTRIMGDDWFTCHSDDKLDSDHFYVSTNGNAVLEGA